MRVEHVVGDEPATGAAVLDSCHSPGRALHVVVDGAAGLVTVTVLAEVPLAFGATPCVLRRHGAHAATAIARVPLRSIDQPDLAVPLFDANVALTWAMVSEGAAGALDVAGAAYVFWPGEVRPEEFRARRRDDLNDLRVAAVPDVRRALGVEDLRASRPAKSPRKAREVRRPRRRPRAARGHVVAAV